MFYFCLVEADWVSGYLGIEEHCFNKHLCLWSKKFLKSNYVPTFVLPLIYWVETRLERQVWFLC